MSDITITLIQTHLHWEDAEANKKHFESLFKKIEKQTDLIILPEMFTTGFTMNSELHFETMEGDSIKWMKIHAQKLNIHIVGSLILKDNNLFYNRLIVAYPDGRIDYYDKRHLFRMANEHQHFAPGKKKLTINIKGWNITPLVCYDLRFPVWSRNRDNNTDIYLYIANWPEARSNAWKTLLKARAIENLSYVVGVNRIGKDGKQITYTGNSAFIDYKGDYMHEAKPNEEEIVTATLSKSSLLAFRDKFPAHLDADSFKLISN